MIHVPSENVDAQKSLFISGDLADVTDVFTGLLQLLFQSVTITALSGLSTKKLELS